MRASEAVTTTAAAAAAATATAVKVGNDIENARAENVCGAVKRLANAVESCARNSAADSQNLWGNGAVTHTHTKARSRTR